jgi:hypothetical protein
LSYKPPQSAIVLSCVHPGTLIFTIDEVGRQQITGDKRSQITGDKMWQIAGDKRWSGGGLQEISGGGLREILGRLANNVWGLGILLVMASGAQNLRFWVCALTDLGFRNFRMAPLSS